MKIICQQKEFRTHLAIANRAVPTRPTQPVLGHILLDADQLANQLTLTGFDLNIGIATTFDVEVVESGKITIPSKLLRDIVSRLPDGEIVLSWEPREEEDAPILINLTTASGKFQFSGLPAEEFPKLPTAESGKIVELPASVLLDGLKVLFSAATDETKMILTGVNIAWDADSIKFAATDGHRLAVVNTTSAILSPEQLNSLGLDGITIHHYALEQLKAILMGSPDLEPDYLVELQIDEDQLIFYIGNQKLYCRRISGNYPAYEQLIPHQFCREAVVNRKELLSAVELVSILSNNDCIKATFNGDSEESVALAADAKGVGSANQVVSAEITGEPIEIGFNLKYLISGLSAINSTDVKLQFNESSSPVIISPLGGLDMTVLIMPAQIRG